MNYLPTVGPQTTVRHLAPRARERTDDQYKSENDTRPSSCPYASQRLCDHLRPRFYSAPGSVKPANVAEFMAHPDIDGALVGGASLEPGSFHEIVKAAIQVSDDEAKAES